MAEDFSFLDHVPIGLLALRQDYLVLFWNSYLEEYTGISRQDIVGTNLEIRYPHLAQPAYRSRLEGVFAGGPPVVFSSQLHKYIIPVRQHNGQLRVQQTTVTAVPASDGHQLYALFAIEDVTDLTRQVQEHRQMRDQALAEARERQRAEEAVRQYASELETRNEELDAYSHTVAHDLQGPLNVIAGYADLLSAEDTGDFTAKQQTLFAHKIGHMALSMSNIIRELLLLSQIRKADIQRAPLDMPGIVTEVQQRLAPQLETSQAKLSLPTCWPDALGYSPWIEEVWTNYISNAIKYGGQPPCIQLGADLLANGQVRFWTRDNGPGITPEDAGRLFSQFTRLDQVRVKGHGLGLSIVRRIIEKLDGQVSVESQLGHGSQFSFTLPCA